MDISVEKILEFQDLFPFERDFDVKSVLCKYNRLKVMLVANILSMNYGNAYIPDPMNPFFSEISQHRVDELNSLMDSFFEDQKIEKVIYCTQRSILELLRITFSIPTEKFQDDGAEEDLEYDFFRIILFINQELMDFKTSKDIKDIAELTFLISYVSNDVTNADWKQTFQTQFYYLDRLSNFLSINPQGLELKRKLLKHIGISDLKHYTKTIIALATLYVNEQKKNRRGCPTLNLDTIKDDSGFINKSVCDYISIDINAFIPYNSDSSTDRENNVDYRMFRSHPLIKITDNEYLIYNLPLLCERLYNSMFFDLKDLYADGDFFQFYTKEIVEHQIFQFSMLNCLGKKSSYHYPIKEVIHSFTDQNEDPYQPDFYIREKDALMLFECKGIKISGNIKDKADIDELIGTLKNKLFFSEENIASRKRKKISKNVGVTQLINHMELIEDDKFPWDSEIPDDVSYYPVLVLEDPKLTQMGVSGIINNWYQPLIIEKLPEAMCHPILVMSIDTLFLYSEVFKTHGFRAIFDRFFKHRTKDLERGVSWQFNKLSDFNSFMRATYKVPAGIQEYYLSIIHKLNT